MNVFVSPSVLMIRAFPALQAFEKRFRSCRKFGNNKVSELYAETIDHSEAMQMQIVGLLSSILTTLIFGSLVPPLLLVAPIGIWLQLCGKADSTLAVTCG